MNTTAKLFETLGHQNRLDVMALLMRRNPEALCAGQIADILGFQPSTLSNYLKALLSVEAITQERDGTRMKYRPNITQLRTQFEAFLTVEMNSRIDLLPKTRHGQAGGTGTGPAPSILFLCPGNSGRSQMAEAVFRQVLNDRFVVASAGTNPAQKVNAELLMYLRSQGYSTKMLIPKSIPSAFKQNPVYDFIVTLCSEVADRGRMSLPPILSFRAHWPLLPLKVKGEAANVDEAHAVLLKWAKAFAKLPFATMPPDQLADQFESIAQQGVLK